MIYDCFTFFNELELLEIRLNTLDPVVDKFVIVEATHTHSGLEKPLHFEQAKQRFEEFSHKIIHIVVNDLPVMANDRWALENFQRNAISRGLVSCQPDDVIIVSDIDEIVNPQAVLDNWSKPGIKIFQQRMYYYFLNCELEDAPWEAPKMAFYKDMHSPQWLREYPKPNYPHKWQRSLAKRMIKLRQAFIAKDILIQNGGWHFSYLGGIDRIKEKIKSFAHSEYDNEHFLNEASLLDAISNAKDLYGRNYKFRIMPLDPTFPPYLTDNQDRFDNLIRHPEIGTIS